MDTKKEFEPRSTEVVAPVVEAAKSAEQNLEVSSWMEKIEKKVVITDDAVVVQQQPISQQPPVTLPVNQQQMVSGKKAKTDLGIAWLVTWVIRKIKMMAKSGQRVKFSDASEDK